MNAITSRLLPALVVFAVLIPELPGLGAGIPEPSVILYGTIRNIEMENVRVTTGNLSWRFREPATGWSVVLNTTVTNLLDQFSYVLEVPCEQVISTTLSTNALNLSGTSKTFDCALVSYGGAPVGFMDQTQVELQLSARDRGRMIRVDLIIAEPCLDLDLNGLCDEWELTWLDFVGADPGGDEDHDGFSNALEYRTGTDPQDPESRFQFLSMERVGPTSVALQWQSADGRRYSIFRYSSLLSSNPTLVLDRLMATGPVTAWVDTNASPSGAYFYRLRLEP